jgi:alkanesulfonate monooxygenase SsuD/methylene tetrahydromethanopterin reductase-like flavin-dependent oxidoreductase (luciferase family)
MRFAINVPNFGDFADPLVIADLARRTEEAGWDGLFVWDHVTHRKTLRRHIADPWVLLTAATLATRRIRLGTMVTPVARRRVSKLAREVTTLDRLSGGRMILGVGLGAPLDDEFGSFGESADGKEVAAHLDEGLTALDLLWSGEPVTFRGDHVVVDDVTFLPTPVQRPRVPVWVGGRWPARPPMRRAARWDGAAPILPPGDSGWSAQPDAATVREIGAFLAEQRVAAGLESEPFDLAMQGTSPADPAAAADLLGSLEQAGATWWQECDYAALESAEPMLRRADRGPPRLLPAPPSPVPPSPVPPSPDSPDPDPRRRDTRSPNARCPDASSPDSRRPDTRSRHASSPDARRRPPGPDAQRGPVRATPRRRRVPPPMPQGLYRLPHPGLVLVAHLAGQPSGLEFGAQPVHMGEDLAAEWPAVGLFRGVGAQQVGQLVLLPPGLLKVILEHLGQRLSREVTPATPPGQTSEAGPPGQTSEASPPGQTGEASPTGQTNVTDVLTGYRLGLEQLAVGADRAGQLGQHGGEPGPGFSFPDRAVLAVDPDAVSHRTRQHPHAGSRSLQRVDAVPQASRRVDEPEPAGVQPDAFLGLPERVVYPLDLAAQRPGALQPLGSTLRVGPLGQPVRHLAEQVGHLPAEVADRFLGRLDAQRGEEQPGRQPGGGTDQRLGDAAGRGGVGVDGEDQHGADRYLEQVLAQPQDQPEPERARDEQPEHIPAERDVRGHRDGREHARGDPHHPLDGAADGVEQGRLHHQQCGQRREHVAGRRARQSQREQVREHRRQRQPGDVHRGRLGAPAHQRKLLGLPPGGLANVESSHWIAHRRTNWTIQKIKLYPKAKYLR